MTTNQRRSEFYREQNERCAAIIASDPGKYPGLMQEWAELVLKRAEAPAKDAEAGPLFKNAAQR